MTEKPISLSKVRKARAKQAARKTADENAVKFGRTKLQKRTEQLEAERKARLWQDHKRDKDET